MNKKGLNVPTLKILGREIYTNNKEHWVKEMCISLASVAFSSVLEGAEQPLLQYQIPASHSESAQNKGEKISLVSLNGSEIECKPYSNPSYPRTMIFFWVAPLILKI